ncbi:MAG: nucleotidyltransferase [Candidatus Aenigmatarchaeota archaeon]|nr:MAG: nucleotidyltransferase [Candidatus Aenigmarchaeota archaeon]
MKTLEEIKKVLKEHKKELKEKYGVKRIGIFGSFARGEQNERSDVDVIVEFENGKATLDNFMELTELLEKIFGRKVDLLTKEGVKSIRLKDVRKNIEERAIYA